MEKKSDTLLKKISDIEKNLKKEMKNLKKEKSQEANEYLTKAEFSSECLTALQLACIDGNREAVKHLIKYGKDVNECNETGNTALHCTAERGNLQLLEYLIQSNGDITICNRDGDSVLHYACMSDNVALVTHLLDSGLQIDSVNDRQITPLMIAARCGRVEVVKFLKHRDCNFTSLDKKGNCVLHYASRSDNVALVAYLLDSGLQIDCANNDEVIPLMIAAQCGRLKVVKFLNKRGCNFTYLDKKGNSVLHYACKSSNFKLVNYLLDSGLQIDCVNYEQVTPLMIAAQCGRVKVVKFFKKRGCNFTYLDKEGNSLLHYACKSGNVKLVNYLLDSGLQIDCVNYEQVTPLMIAAVCGEPDIRKSVSNIRAVDKFGNSVLHYACKSDNVALVTYLLDSGLQVDCMNYEQVTPLMRAARNGKPDIVNLLETRGTNITALDKYGYSVLHYACMSDNVALVTHLLDSGLQIDCMNNDQETPLMRAAWFGQLDTVKLLEENGSNFTALDKFGNSLLHYACMSDNVALVIYLLDSGLQIDYANYDHVTPLMKAAWYGKLDVVKLLETRGSNFIALDKHNNSVLHYACKSDNVALVTYLLDSGLQIDCVNCYQATPLMRAAWEGKLEIVKLLEENDGNFRALDRVGNSVLHYACGSDNVALVTHLLDSGLQVDCVNYGQVTPLMIAAWYGKLDIVKLLETRGSNLIAIDQYSNSVLHYACKSDNVALVTYLLDSGLQIDCVNCYEATPVMIAAQCGRLKVVKFLKKIGSNFTHLDKKGNSVLHYACRSDNIALVTDLLDSGLQIDCLNNKQGTPLMTAAWNGKLDTVKLLEIRGSNFTIVDINGDSVLHYACMSDNVALVSHLLDSGLRIDCANNEQVTPLMRAASNGKLNIVKLLETRGSNFTVVDKNGDSVALCM